MVNNAFRYVWYFSGFRLSGVMLPAPPWMISRGLTRGFEEGEEGEELVTGLYSILGLL